MRGLLSSAPARRPLHRLARALEEARWSLFSSGARLPRGVIGRAASTRVCRSPYPRPTPNHTMAMPSPRPVRALSQVRVNQSERNAGSFVLVGGRYWARTSDLCRETEVGCLRINDMRAVPSSATRACCHLVSLDITQCNDRTVPRLSQADRSPCSQRPMKDQTSRSNAVAGYAASL
jgi:hypothetical protein